MKKQERDSWVEALRSGEYKQGSNQLYIPGDNSYCCIGVWCRVNGISISKNGRYMGSDGGESYTAFKESLSVSIGKQEEISAKLTGMNDGFGDFDKKTFPEIADWIEENVKADDEEEQT